MGADLYESYAGARLSAMALGVSAGLGFQGMMIPMALSALGIFASIIGSFFVKTDENASQKTCFPRCAAAPTSAVFWSQSAPSC